MNNHRHFPAIRDDLAAVLATEAGVERSSRIFPNFVSRAAAMLSDHNYRPPTNVETPTGRLCEEWRLAKAFADNERNRLATASAARREAALAARDALTAAPPGMTYLNVKGVDGLIYRLTLPEEQVERISVGGPA